MPVPIRRTASTVRVVSVTLLQNGFAAVSVDYLLHELSSDVGHMDPILLAQRPYQPATRISAICSSCSHALVTFTAVVQFDPLHPCCVCWCHLIAADSSP